MYHVLSRGNEGRPIFADDRDRAVFLEVLGRMCARFNVEVFSYVLMDNHYHLLLRTPKGNLSKSMQWFGVSYTRYFNIRHGRSGHLFQGRFKAFLIENERYLVQASFYVHRNPLRAGIVPRLAEYQWSSYPVYAYAKKGPSWLNTEVVLAQVSGADPVTSYRRAVQSYAEEKWSIWEEVRHGLVLGSKTFVERIRREYLKGVPHREIPQQRALLRDESATEFLAEAGLGARAQDKDLRDLSIYLLWESGRYTNQEIGEAFGITYSAVSRRVKAVRDRLAFDPLLGKKYRRLRSRMKC